MKVGIIDSYDPGAGSGHIASIDHPGLLLAFEYDQGRHPVTKESEFAPRLSSSVEQRYGRLKLPEAGDLVFFALDEEMVGQWVYARPFLEATERLRGTRFSFENQLVR